MSTEPTHLDEHGRVRMVDVGAKPPLVRTAVARVILRAAAPTLDLMMAGDLPKGEALATARIAGILAAKKTDELIPMCHQLPLDWVQVDFDRAGAEALQIRAEARTTARTGVEMEALTAATVAALTLYDMAKAVDKGMRIDELELVEKSKRAPESGGG